MPASFIRFYSIAIMLYGKYCIFEKLEVIVKGKPDEESLISIVRAIL
jgi:hypothetical protein